MKLQVGTEIPSEVWEALGARSFPVRDPDVRGHVIIEAAGREFLVPESSKDENGTYWVDGQAFVPENGNVQEARAKSFSFWKDCKVRPAVGRSPCCDQTEDEQGWQAKRAFGNRVLFVRPLK